MKRAYLVELVITARIVAGQAVATSTAHILGRESVLSNIHASIGSSKILSVKEDNDNPFGAMPGEYNHSPEDSKAARAIIDYLISLGLDGNLLIHSLDYREIAETIYLTRQDKKGEMK